MLQNNVKEGKSVKISQGKVKSSRPIHDDIIEDIETEDQ